MSETQVLSASSFASFSSSSSSHTHNLTPLTSMTAASSTGRPVGGATHVLTSPWQPLSSPCPPRHTHSLKHTRSHSPTPTNLKIHTEFLGLHPVQDKLNPHALPAIFEKSIHGSSLNSDNFGSGLFFSSNHLVDTKISAALLFCV